MRSIYETSIERSLRIPSRQLFRGGYQVYTIGINPATPLGVLALIPSRNATHIDYICVEKGSRSLGLGSRLLEWTIRRYPVVTLECRGELVTYYSTRGFHPMYTYSWRGQRLVFMSTYGTQGTPRDQPPSDQLGDHPSELPSDQLSDHPPLIPICIRFIELFFKKRIS